MGGVSCAPHDPRGSGCEGTGEGKHLDTRVALECRVGNDSVLDGIGCSCTDRDGSEHFKNGPEYHRLSVGDGAG